MARARSTSGRGRSPQREQELRFLRQMVRIRVFDEQVDELYRSAKMPGLAHLYHGQEAVAVGVCEALRADDYITSTHRGHGHCLAKGAVMDKMYAELLGKAAGYCAGKGGSMHIADPDTGNLGANAIVGAGSAIATGAAMSAKMRGSGQVAACFMGEGAFAQGVLYESMNMASLWKLPVLYVCENNRYSEYTPYERTTAGNLQDRAPAFGIPAETIDGQDVRVVHEAAARLVERARRGDGPAFLIAETYRYQGHHVGDVDRRYRSREEEERWKTQRDPIVILSRWLKEQGAADDEVLGEIDREARAESDGAVRFALDAPYPDPSAVDEHVYA